jgi:peptidoglycan/LPS O-acetylase OafA/YrhL
MTIPATILERRKNPATAPKPLLPRALSPMVSFLLDLIRLSAALCVVAGHLGHPELKANLPNLQILGDISVTVFFVLSGFVIRHVTLAREHTLRGYLIDRASRIYSVALPAMVLTLALAFACSRIDPAYYTHYFAEHATHPLTRVLFNLVFVSQSWGHNTIPFIDLPFWSLSYECLYYVGYGLFFYLRGLKRVIALILLAAIAGPQVLFLAPIWLLGCAVYDIFQLLRHHPFAVSAMRLAALCLFPFLAIVLVAEPKRVAAPFTWFINLPNPLQLLHMDPMRATLFAFTAGVIAAAMLLPALILIDSIWITANQRMFHRFRRIADGTFAIYLMHYPLMVFATAAGLFQPHSPARDIAVAVAICLLLIALAGPLDRLKIQIRSALRALILPLATHKGAALATAANTVESKVQNA